MYTEIHYQYNLEYIIFLYYSEKNQMLIFTCYALSLKSSVIEFFMFLRHRVSHFSIEQSYRTVLKFFLVIMNKTFLKNYL